MAPREDKTYFLYGAGYHPEQLCLGHLVFGDYANPTRSRHFNVPKMSEAELKQVAYVNDLRGCFTSESGKSANLGLEGFEFANLGAAFKTSRSRIILARKGSKIELKDSPTFFGTNVCNTPGARDTLALWLTVANSDYIWKAKVFKKPKVWCLTGLYEFEDVKAFESESSNPTFNASIGSALVAALSGVPIGGSVDLKAWKTIKEGTETKGPAVWAAQYQRLDVAYFRKKDSATAPSLPVQIELLADFSRPGGERRGAEEKADGVAMGLEKPDPDNSFEEQDEEEKYWKAFDVAEKRILENRAAEAKVAG